MTFHHDIVRTGLIDVETSKYLQLTEDIRLRSDYTFDAEVVDDPVDDFINVVTKKDAEKSYKEACIFVDQVESSLDSIRECYSASPDKPSTDDDPPANQ